MTAAEQLAEIAARSTIHYDVAARQVAAGYIVNGNTRYVETATGNVLAAVSHETIAVDADGAAAKISTYLNTGKFV